MPRISGGIEASRLNALPDDLAHRFTGQAATMDPAVAIHRSKDRAAINA
jgi:hypothetical protein